MIDKLYLVTIEGTAKNGCNVIGTTLSQPREIDMEAYEAFPNKDYDPVKTPDRSKEGFVGYYQEAYFFSPKAAQEFINDIIIIEK